MKSKPKNKILSFSKLFPNIVTMVSICFGLTSIRYALDQKWEIAVSLIIIAGFLDIIDGRLARFLKATSNFGAYLDSLADFINFGISPSIVLYLWTLKDIESRGAGWAIVLFFSICVSIRLARFNSDLEDDKQKETMEMFFKGVPAPAGAYLALVPMMLDFRLEYELSNYSLLIASYMILIAILLVSKFATFSTKKIVISREYVALFFVIIGLIIALIIIEPWLVLPIIGVFYLITIPFSIKYSKQF